MSVETPSCGLHIRGDGADRPGGINRELTGSAQSTLRPESWAIRSSVPTRDLETYYSQELPVSDDSVVESASRVRWWITGIMRRERSTFLLEFSWPDTANSSHQSMQSRKHTFFIVCVRAPELQNTRCGGP